MRSRTTYWQNSFPNHLEFTFQLEELKLAGAFDLPDDDDPVVPRERSRFDPYTGVKPSG
jgi:hypothetical protein